MEDIAFENLMYIKDPENADRTRRTKKFLRLTWEEFLIESTEALIDKHDITEEDLEKIDIYK